MELFEKTEFMKIFEKNRILLKYHLKMPQQIIPPNIQYKIIKYRLIEQIFHQIYSGLIPLDTILWPWFSVQKQGQVHMDLTPFLH